MRLTDVREFMPCRVDKGYFFVPKMRGAIP
jgi:hypothetical protein